MRRAIATACVLAMMAGGVWAQTSGSQAPAVHTHKSHTAKSAKTKKRAATIKKEKAAAPAQGLPAQTLPPVPATLMNSAPVKPNVTMERGLLTIDAPNSTLSDVLSGVHKATGAAIEGASPTERVAVRLGPGEPEQVIAALLRGTSYDYVILGSLGRQDVVTRVLLTQSSPSSTSSSGGQPEPAPPDVSGLPGPRTGMSPHQPQMDNAQPIGTVPEEVAPAVESEQDQAQQPPPQPSQPPPPQQEPSKSPDQLFKELQQLGLGQPGIPAQPKPPQ